MNNTKVCSRCQEEKLLTEFYSRGKNRKDVNTFCKKCFNTYCVERWVKKKLEAIEYKGGKCEDCSGVFPYPVFEFHHLDPTEKDVNWTKLRLRSKDKREAELDKCALLCANCHRLRHHNEK